MAVYVQPRAAKTEYVGLHGTALKFRVAAPPVDGLANAALCRYLAEACHVPKNSVEVCFGRESRQKRILFKGISAKYIKEIFSI